MDNRGIYSVSENVEGYEVYERIWITEGYTVYHRILFYIAI